MKKRMLLVGMLVLAMMTGLVGCGSSENDSALNVMGSDTKEYAKEEAKEENADVSYEMDREEEATEEKMTEQVMDDMDSAEPAALAGETYAEIIENAFVNTAQENTSTFSIDVDTASYTNIRRMIMDGYRPNPDAVRIEEMINYFDYGYEGPIGDDPFAISTATAVCPWNPDNLVTMVGLKGYELEQGEVPPSNIVLLIDVSGSMNSPDKLPLLKDAFKTLAKNFTQEDRVSIVVYAGAAGVVLDGANGSKYRDIERALDSLSAGGSTAGGQGIELAYRLAEENFIQDGNNRVILATDGDFNVGMSSPGVLEDYIAEKRQSDIFLSVIGFGTGNIRDDIMETLANKGNGNYAYIDSYDEAERVFSKEFSGTMFTIAKDVKIQLAFNEQLVKSYRLIGYENRMLENQDFTDDTKDAGELGAGHEVTAIYELEMSNGQNVDAEDLYEVKLRYKRPDEDQSNEIVVLEKQSDILDSIWDNQDLYWALTVAEFGMVLRGSQYVGDDSLQRVLEQAQHLTGQQDDELRMEFVDLVRRVKVN